MDPSLSFFIMMNNYFNDAAIAMMPASAIFMQFVMKRYEHEKKPENMSAVLSTYTRMSTVVVIILICLTVTSIPRILTFSSFELANASGRQNVLFLVARHVIALAITISGACLWIALNRRLKRTMVTDRKTP